MALLFSHLNSVQSKMMSYADVGKGKLGITMLCKLTASAFRGFPKSSVLWISPHAPQCFKLMKKVDCEQLSSIDVPIIVCTLESMKTVLDRALGTEQVYKEASGQLGEAMTEFFSSVFYLTKDSSPIVLYKTGFSEMAKYPNAFHALQNQKWFDQIKKRLLSRNPAAQTEIFAMQACDPTDHRCWMHNDDHQILSDDNIPLISQTITESTEAQSAPDDDDDMDSDDKKILAELLAQEKLKRGTA